MGRGVLERAARQVREGMRGDRDKAWDNSAVRSAVAEESRRQDPHRGRTIGDNEQIPHTAIGNLTTKVLRTKLTILDASANSVQY